MTCKNIHIIGVGYAAIENETAYDVHKIEFVQKNAPCNLLLFHLNLDGLNGKELLDQMTPCLFGTMNEQKEIEFTWDYYVYTYYVYTDQITK